MPEPTPDDVNRTDAHAPSPDTGPGTTPHVRRAGPEPPEASPWPAVPGYDMLGELGKGGIPGLAGHGDQIDTSRAQRRGRDHRRAIERVIPV